MNRDFTGIWIPAEIWLSDLSVQEKCLWAEIHSLTNRKEGGCYESLLPYLCKKFRVKQEKMRKWIFNLEEKEFLKRGKS